MEKGIEVKEAEASKIWKEYQNGIKYQRSMGFIEDFPKFVDFKEGKQWNKPTERTKNFPRPRFNITEMFITRKRASIANQPVQMTFKPIETSADETENEKLLKGANDYTDFARVLWENLKQDELNNDFVDDALTVGTGILHYYFDDTIEGSNGGIQYKGDLRGETLDALNVFFENPQERDVNRQKYIIIQTRKNVKDVIELAEKNGVSKAMQNLINADKNDSGQYSNEEKAESEADNVTLLIKYYKKDGQVYYSKSTQSVMIEEGKMLKPLSSSNGITLYPIVVLSGMKRKKSIYGISVAQDVITLNKLYNQLKAMQALNCIQCGNPTMIVKKGALRQQVTNEGGQILTDYYAGGGDGIKYMQPPQFSNMFSQVSAEIFEMARTMTGVTDVSTGEALGANMAASAIIALQNTAKTPIKELQTRYYKALQEVGAIWCEFFKSFYHTSRKISIENEEGNMEARLFKGTNYSDIDFKIKIEIGVTSENESLILSMLDTLRQRQDITKEQYVDLAPDTSIPFKRELKLMWEKQNKDEMIRALEIIKQQQVIISQLEAQSKQNEETTQQLTQQIEESRAEIESLTSETQELENEAKKVKIQREKVALSKEQLENMVSFNGIMGGGQSEMQDV